MAASADAVGLPAASVEREAASPAEPCTVEGEPAVAGVERAVLPLPGAAAAAVAAPTPVATPGAPGPAAAVGRAAPVEVAVVVAAVVADVEPVEAGAEPPVVP